MSRRNFVLACVAGALLGLSFPLPRGWVSTLPLDYLACIAFVPFLLVLDRLDSYWQSMRCAYLTFLVFNAVTLYWVGGFTHGQDMYLMLSGAALVVAHPLFFLVPTLAYCFVRRHLGTTMALFSLPFVWVGFEWLHSLGQIGFPWLTLGNSQTHAIDRIQFISFTGVYGISFWILALNAIIYFVYLKFASSEWKLISRQSLFAGLALFLFLIIPEIHGRIVLSSGDSRSSRGVVRVGMIQPNTDPWKKWETNPEDQLESYFQMTTGLLAEEPQLVIWPETAIPFRILLGKYSASYHRLKDRIDSLRFALLTGYPETVFYQARSAPPGSRLIEGTKTYYDDFNAIMLLQPRIDSIQKYSKMKLVPFAERVPYAEKLSFLVEAVKWNVGISGWGIGKDTTVFSLKADDRTIRFSGMVCYESIYPDLVAAFVRKGAQFLVVITNDSWWGNTSGANQHFQYATLRAIENHRAIARCANGGISCFIDPYGRISEARELFTQSTLIGNVQFSEGQTFYSKHGDVFARACTGVGVVAILGAFIGRFRRK
ncbi:MAG: apolipoprotein N-acyltransferase [Bacteroidota bacterium]